jgi:hypothetical protein
MKIVAARAVVTTWVVLVAVAPGCSGDLPKSDVVDKLRVLAVRASPPEIAPGQTSVLDALVVGPPLAADAAVPRLSYLWLACTETAGLALPGACGVTVDGNGGPGTFAAPDGGVPAAIPSCQAQPNAPLCLLGQTSTVSLSPSPPLSGSQVTQVIITLIVSDQDALACAAFAAEGTGAPPDPDHCVIAIKRLTVSNSASPNHNPELAKLSLNVDFMMGTAQLPALAGGEALPLDAKRCTPALCAEAVAACCLPGSGAEIKADAQGAVEPLAVAWFTTAGSLADARSSFQPSDCDSACQKDPARLAADVSTIWTAPDPSAYAASNEIDFWAVVRDGREGVGWLKGSLTTAVR